MDNNIFEHVKIETPRLLLTNFHKYDKEEFFHILQDPLIYKTLPEDHMYSKEEVSQIIDWFIKRYKENKIGDIAKFPLSIKLKLNKKIIGDIGIGEYSQDKTKLEVFYFINSIYWNKGYVSEAMHYFMEYISSKELVDYLIGTVVKENIASKKILIKNGFYHIEHSYNDEREIYYKNMKKT